MLEYTGSIGLDSADMKQRLLDAIADAQKTADKNPVIVSVGADLKSVQKGFGELRSMTKDIQSVAEIKIDLSRTRSQIDFIDKLKGLPKESRTLGSKISKELREGIKSGAFGGYSEKDTLDNIVSRYMGRGKTASKENIAETMSLLSKGAGSFNYRNAGLDRLIEYGERLENYVRAMNLIRNGGSTDLNGLVTTVQLEAATNELDKFYSRAGKLLKQDLLEDGNIQSAVVSAWDEQINVLNGTLAALEKGGAGAGKAIHIFTDEEKYASLSAEELIDTYHRLRKEITELERASETVDLKTQRESLDRLYGMMTEKGALGSGRDEDAKRNKASYVRQVQDYIRAGGEISKEQAAYYNKLINSKMLLAERIPLDQIKSFGDQIKEVYSQYYLLQSVMASKGPEIPGLQKSAETARKAGVDVEALANRMVDLLRTFDYVDWKENDKGRPNFYSVLKNQGLKEQFGEYLSLYSQYDKLPGSSKMHADEIIGKAHYDPYELSYYSAEFDDYMTSLEKGISAREKLVSDGTASDKIKTQLESYKRMYTELKSFRAEAESSIPNLSVSGNAGVLTEEAQAAERAAEAVDRLSQAEKNRAKGDNVSAAVRETDEIKALVAALDECMNAENAMYQVRAQAAKNPAYKSASDSRETDWLNSLNKLRSAYSDAESKLGRFNADSNTWGLDEDRAADLDFALASMEEQAEKLSAITAAKQRQAEASEKQAAGNEKTVTASAEAAQALNEEAKAAERAVEAEEKLKAAQKETVQRGGTAAAVPSVSVSPAAVPTAEEKTDSGKTIAETALQKGHGNVGITDSEVQAVLGLKTSVSDVTQAVEAKTEAFRTEEAAVSSVVSNEVERLNELKNKIIEITAALDEQIKVSEKAAEARTIAVKSAAQTGSLTSVSSGTQIADQNVGGAVKSDVSIADLKNVLTEVSALLPNLKVNKNASVNITELSAALDKLSATITAFTPDNRETLTSLSSLSGIQVNKSSVTNLSDLAEALKRVNEALSTFGTDARGSLGLLSDLLSHTNELKSLDSILKNSKNIGTVKRAIKTDKTSDVSKDTESQSQTVLNPVVQSTRTLYSGGKIFKGKPRVVDEERLKELSAAYDNVGNKAAKYFDLLQKRASGATLTNRQSEELTALDSLFERAIAGEEEFEAKIVGTDEVYSAFVEKLKTTAGAFGSEVSLKADSYITKASTGDLANAELIKERVAEIKGLVTQIHNLDFTKVSDVQRLTEIQSRIRDIFASFKGKDFKPVNEKARETWIMRAAQFGSNRNLTADMRADLQLIQNSMRNANSEADMSHAISQLNELETAAYQAGRTGQSFSARWKKSMGSLLTYLSTFMSFYRVVSVVREGVNTVKELNSEIMTLSQVTGKSMDALEGRLNSFVKTAKEVGGTVTDTITAVTDWSRLGYSLDQAEELAKAAMIYKNISKDVTIDQANEYLTSTMQGFGIQAEQAMDVVDMINEVSNRTPIDQAGLGEVFQRSAATFKAAGTSLQSAAALAVGANSVLQDPDQVGTMWSTVAMRIRGAKAELEEAGEDTEGMIESTSELRGLVKSMTGFDIMADENSFKDIREIVVGIGKEWDKLTDVNQSSLLEALAGKRQANVLSAALNNYELIEQAYDIANNSSGSATRANEKYLDEVSGKTAQLKADVQAFWSGSVDSGLIKNFTSLADVLVNIADTLSDIAGFGGKWNSGGLTLLGGIAGGVLAKKDLKLIAGGDGGKLPVTSPMLTEVRKFLTGRIPVGDATPELRAMFKRMSQIKDADGWGSIYRAMPASWDDARKTQFKTFASQQAALVSESGRNMTPEQYANQWKTYAKSLNEVDKGFAAAQRSARGFGSSLKGLGSIAANAAAGMGVMAAIQLAIAGIGKLTDAMKSTGEEMKRANELGDELRHVRDTDSTNITKIRDLNETYKDLSKGVSAAGENIRLTDEEYERYISTVTELSSLMPNLETFWDSQGRKIGFVKGQLTDANAEYEKYMQQQAAKTIVNGNEDGLTGEDLIKGFNATKRHSILQTMGDALESMWGGSLDYEDFAAVKAAPVLEKALSLDQKELADFLLTESDDTKALRVGVVAGNENLRQLLGINGSDIAKMGQEAMAREDFQTLRETMQAYLQNYQAEMDAQASNIKEWMFISAKSGLDYWDLSDDKKNMVTGIIGKLNTEAVYRYQIEDQKDVTKIANRIIAAVKDNDELGQAWTELFKLDKDTLSAGEYRESARNYIESIAEAIGLESVRGKKAVAESLGIDAEGLGLFADIAKYDAGGNTVFAATSDEIDAWAEKVRRVKEMMKGSGVTLTDVEKNFTAPEIDAILEGKVNVSGMTLESAKKKVEAWFNEHPAEAAAEVKLNDKFTKLENSGMADSIGKLKDAMDAIAEDGKVSYSTVAEISDTFKNAVPNIEKYIKVLLDADSTAQECAGAITSITEEYIQNKIASGKLTDADEDMVASLLDEAGIANSVVIAHEMVSQARARAAVEAYRNGEITYKEAQDLINEALSAEQAEAALARLELAKLAVNNTVINTSSDIDNIINLARTAGAAAAALATLSTAKEMLETGDAQQIRWAREQIDKVNAGTFDYGFSDDNGNEPYKGTTPKFKPPESKDKDKDKVKDVQDQLDDLAKAEAPEKLKYKFDCLEQSIEKVTTAIDLLKSTAELHNENDFVGKLETVTRQADLSREKLALLKDEFSQLSSQSYTTADEAAEIASRMKTVADSVSETNKDLLEYAKNVAEYYTSALRLVGSLSDRAMERAASLFDRNVKSIEDGGLAGLSFNIGLDVPQSAVEKQRRENNELEAELKGYYDRVAQMQKTALDMQYQEQLAENAKKRQELRESLAEAESEIKGFGETVKAEQKETNAETTAEQKRDDKAKIEETTVFTGKFKGAFEKLNDWITQNPIKAPELDTVSWQKMVDDAKSYAEQVNNAYRGGFSDGSATGSGKGAEIVETAKRYLGSPYVWGGESETAGWDCSGFVRNILSKNGISVTGNTDTQWFGTQGVKVNGNDLQPGDVLFFTKDGGASIYHEAIYIGNNRIIHAKGSSYGTVEEELSDTYKRRLAGVKRFFAKGTKDFAVYGNNIDGVAGENYRREILVDKKTGGMTLIDSPTLFSTGDYDVVGEETTAKALRGYATGTPTTNPEILGYIKKASEATGVPANIIMAVMDQETGYKWYDAVPDGRGYSHGYMMLYDYGALADMDTATRQAAKTDKYTNVLEGAKLLARNYNRYGDWQTAITRYNGSGSAAAKYGQQVWSRANSAAFIKAADNIGAFASEADGLVSSASSASSALSEIPETVTEIKRSVSERVRDWIDGVGQTSGSEDVELGDALIKQLDEKLDKSSFSNEEFLKKWEAFIEIQNETADRFKDMDKELLASVGTEGYTAKKDEVLSSAVEYTRSLMQASGEANLEQLKEQSEINKAVLKEIESFYFQKRGEGASADVLQTVADAYNEQLERVEDISDKWVSQLNALTEYLVSENANKVAVHDNRLSWSEKELEELEHDYDKLGEDDYEEGIRLSSEMINKYSDIISENTAKQNTAHQNVLDLYRDDRFKAITDKWDLESWFDANGEATAEFTNVMKYYNDIGDSEGAALAKQLFTLIQENKKAYYEAGDVKRDASDKREELLSGQKLLKVEAWEKYQSRMAEIAEYYKDINDKLLNAKQSLYDFTDGLRDEADTITAQLNSNKHLAEWLFEDTRALLFNEDDYETEMREINRLRDEAVRLYEKYQSDLKNVKEENAGEAEALTAEYNKQVEALQDQLEITKQSLQAAKDRTAIENRRKERDTQVILGNRVQNIADPDELYNLEQTAQQSELRLESLKIGKDEAEDIRQIGRVSDKYDAQIAEINGNLDALAEMTDRQKELFSDMLPPLEYFAAKLNGVVKQDPWYMTNSSAADDLYESTDKDDIRGYNLANDHEAAANTLSKLVEAGVITLEMAQKAIANNWASHDHKTTTDPHNPGYTRHDVSAPVLNEGRDPVRLYPSDAEVLKMLENAGVSEDIIRQCYGVLIKSYDKVLNNGTVFTGEGTYRYTPTVTGEGGVIVDTSNKASSLKLNDTVLSGDGDALVPLNEFVSQEILDKFKSVGSPLMPGMIAPAAGAFDYLTQALSGAAPLLSQFGGAVTDNSVRIDSVYVSESQKDVNGLILQISEIAGRVGSVTDNMR